MTHFSGEPCMHRIDMHILTLAHLNRLQNRHTHTMSNSMAASRGIRRALQGSIVSSRPYPIPIPSHPIPPHSAAEQFSSVHRVMAIPQSSEPRSSCRNPPATSDWSRPKHAHDLLPYKHPKITNRSFGRQRRQKNAHPEQQRRSQNTAH